MIHLSTNQLELQMPTLQTPYLIQRATIVRPLKRTGRFSEVVDLDYMGSSEFEFGALPASLRMLQKHIDDIKLTVEPRLRDTDNHNLRVLHTFNEADYEGYVQHLLNLRADKQRTKECTRFQASYPASRFTVTDLWWDINNHTMFSFDKNFMNRLSDRLVESWKYMNEEKAKRG